jgi:predicted nucleotidyltransferase
MANSKQRETTSAHISEIVRTIKEKFNPRRVILFGSYAYGVPAAKGRGNDIDLFVIMNTSLPVKKQAFLIRRELTSAIPLDVIVRTPEQVEERLRLGDFFIKKIMEQGIEL